MKKSVFALRALIGWLRVIHDNVGIEELRSMIGGAL